MDALEDENAEVRLAAATALGRLLASLYPYRVFALATTSFGIRRESPGPEGRGRGGPRLVGGEPGRRLVISRAARRPAAVQAGGAAGDRSSRQDA